MDLERGVLARIDRKLLAGLGQDETYRMVRVPVTASKWSTWKRYCDSAGISMGRAIATMIDRELVDVFNGSAGDPSLVFAEKAEEELAGRHERVACQAGERASRLDARERQLDTRAEQLRGKEVHLAAGEQQIRAQRMSGTPVRSATKVGRNERCPCGSGRKHKHCHGLAGRRAY